MKHGLVIEESVSVRKLFCGMMEQLGFMTSEAANGKEALLRCASRMPDVILVDRNMPVMNGPSFARALRRLPHGQKPRIIIVSIEDGRDNITEALSSGADDYIAKPFRIEFLASKLECFSAHLG
jgi:two-component system chemotaxis response regulator CheY